MTFICNCGKCDFEHMEYKIPFNFHYKPHKKSGACIHDPVRNQILLVQSRGNLWGLPKGSLENDETFQEGAIREVFEETGIVLKPEMLYKSIKVYGKAMYYYVQLPYRKVSVQQQANNDANAIGWITISCLENLIKHNQIKLTSQTKQVLKNFINLEYNFQD